MNMLLRPALFLHIQKTAGTTIVSLAEQYYGRENVVSHADFVLSHGSFAHGHRPTEIDVAVKPTEEYANVPFVSGHFGFNYAKPLFDGRFSFTFLRDPIERILSFYYFCKTRDPKQYEIYALAHRLPLDEFLQSGLHDLQTKAFIWNSQTWQLASGGGDTNWQKTLNLPPKSILASASEHLEVFSHIGFAETFEKDRDHIFQSLGMPIPSSRIVANANPGRLTLHDLPKKTKDLLYELTDLDRQLYEIAWSRSNLASRRYFELADSSTKVVSDPLTDSLINTNRDYYLGLLQQCLTGSLYGDASFAPFGSRDFDSKSREHGLDWPERAQTMVGDKRLANLRELVTAVLTADVPGDLIETGVWRGGSCILMRAILMAHGDTNRKVWVADSFEGLPTANENLYPADSGSDFHTYTQLAIPLEDVKQNFIDYGLLDEQVVFLKGWFKDTLPVAPINQLALIRLDGDMYESTMVALVNLYPRLSQHGYVIIDDYYIVPACKLAVHDYCNAIGIAPQIIDIDGAGVYWKKTEPAAQHITEAGTKIAISDAALTGRLNEALDKLNRIVIKQLLVSLTKRDVILAKHQSQMTERNLTVASLSQQLESHTKLITEIYDSSSWRITAPFRALSRLLHKIGNEK